MAGPPTSKPRSQIMTYEASIPKVIRNRLYKMDVRQKLWEEATKRWSNQKNSSISYGGETEEPGVKSGGCVPRKRGREPPDATLSNNLSPAWSVPNLQSQLQGTVVFRKHRHMPSGIHTCTHRHTPACTHVWGHTHTQSGNSHRGNRGGTSVAIFPQL